MKVYKRAYHRFSDAARDVVNARAYLGIHFRFADTEARTQRRRVARWAFKHYLRPLHGHGHGHDHDDDDDDVDDDHHHHHHHHHDDDHRR